MDGKIKKKRKRQRKESTHSPSPRIEASSHRTQTQREDDIKRDPSRKKAKVARDDTLSLASQLKRHRGTADSTPLPPKWTKQHMFSKSFLTPSDGSMFEGYQKECYRGFSWEHPKNLPDSLHSTFDHSLDTLYGAGLFLYDAVQAGGKRVSHTFVTRTLVGKPGSTYRYLGLRLFSHPWSAVTLDGDSTGNTKNALASLVQLGYGRSCARALLQIGDLNESLAERTKHVLRKEVAPHIPGGLMGSAEYSLTLINRMEPSSVKKDLKEEKKHGLGKASVSWHKDSGLTDFSSIAVYHTFRETRNSINQIPWCVALRVASDEALTPPLSVPLPGGSLYYLLDDFNHKHEHAVIAGSNQVRYSSTHRVAREGRGTWQYIRNKCNHILTSSKNEDPAASSAGKRKLLVKKTRAQQQLLTEIEFEWLRQWHIQGTVHSKLHPYWHAPMERLSVFFEELEKLALSTLSALKEASKSKTGEHPSALTVSEDLYDIMIENTEERIRLRKTWHERLQDSIYESMPADMRPTASPALDRKTQNTNRHVPEDLVSLVGDLRTWRTGYVRKMENKIKGKIQEKGKDDKRSSLTKKEKRKVASNWEKLQASMSKK